jgi:hypothetical protein
MIEIKRLTDPYPEFSFTALAERTSYESLDEKLKNHLCLRLHSKIKPLKSRTFPSRVLVKRVNYEPLNLSEKARILFT